MVTIHRTIHRTICKWETLVVCIEMIQQSIEQFASHATTMILEDRMLMTERRNLESFKWSRMLPK